MIVVTYRPAADHPDGGEITACIVGTPEMIATLDAPWIEVPEWRPDWDRTHFVLAGELAPIPAEIIAARELAMARVRLRVQRDGLLHDGVDPLVSNPLRWADLSAAQQTEVAAYRRALLDWPDTEADPIDPTPPVKPEFMR